LDGKEELAPGKTCWHFFRGSLSIVTITDIMESDMAYRATVDSGFRKGESFPVLGDNLYRFPEDKDRLLIAIDNETELLRMYKSQVILKKKVI